MAVAGGGDGAGSGLAGGGLGGVGVASLVGVAPAPRLPHGAKAIGSVATSTPISGAVVLKPRDSAALQRFIAGVSDKSSSQFGHYLPAGQFAGRFGPTQATIDAVRSQLQSDGLHVSGVSGDGVLVKFSGSAAKVQSAFHTGFKRYRMSNGVEGRETTSAVSLPSSIAPNVAGVVGLQTLVRPHSEAVRGNPAAAGQFPKAKAAASFPHPPGSPTPCTAARCRGDDHGRAQRRPDPQCVWHVRSVWGWGFRCRAAGGDLRARAVFEV